jgi:hypothetical protein
VVRGSGFWVLGFRYRVWFTFGREIFGGFRNFGGGVVVFGGVERKWGGMGWEHDHYWYYRRLINLQTWAKEWGGAEARKLSDEKREGFRKGKVRMLSV